MTNCFHFSGCSNPFSLCRIFITGDCWVKGHFYWTQWLGGIGPAALFGRRCRTNDRSRELPDQHCTGTQLQIHCWSLCHHLAMPIMKRTESTSPSAAILIMGASLLSVNHVIASFHNWNTTMTYSNPKWCEIASVLARGSFHSLLEAIPSRSKPERFSGWYMKGTQETCPPVYAGKSLLPVIAVGDLSPSYKRIYASLNSG